VAGCCECGDEPSDSHTTELVSCHVNAVNGLFTLYVGYHLLVACARNGNLKPTV
jgi:hypothetical protein